MKKPINNELLIFYDILYLVSCLYVILFFSAFPAISIYLDKVRTLIPAQI